MSKTKLLLAEEKVLKMEEEIQSIMERHDAVTLKLSKEDISQWFESFPISSLMDSLNFERGKPFGIYSLKKLKEKSKLRKLFEKKSEEYDLMKNTLRQEEIKKALRSIKKAQNGNN